MHHLIVTDYAKLNYFASKLLKCTLMIQSMLASYYTNGELHYLSKLLHCI